MKNITHLVPVALMVVVLSFWPALAAEVTIPHEFQANTPAVAQEVNDNFTALKDAVDDNDLRITRRNGTNNINFSNGNVTSTSYVLIDSITINDTETFDVSLTAYVVLEASGDSPGRYYIDIKVGSISGTTVARGWWRPGSASGYQSDTIAFTGFHNGVSGPVTYVLCARKLDSADANALIHQYGLNVEWSID